MPCLHSTVRPYFLSELVNTTCCAVLCFFFSSLVGIPSFFRYFICGRVRFGLDLRLSLSHSKRSRQYMTPPHHSISTNQREMNSEVWNHAQSQRHKINIVNHCMEMHSNPVFIYSYAIINFVCGKYAPTFWQWPLFSCPKSKSTPCDTTWYMTLAIQFIRVIRDACVQRGTRNEQDQK